MQRTLGWLEREALPHWERQIKKAHQAVGEARSEFYRQQLIANPNTPTALKERKAWDRAKEALREAEERQKALRRWLVTWERESALYKGAMSALSESIMHDLPAAAAKINRLVELLEQYAALRSGPDASVAAPTPTPAPAEPAEPGEGGEGAEAPARADVPEPFAGEMPDAFALLRARTPPAALRALTPLTDPAVIAARGTPDLHPADEETLARLDLRGAWPPDEHTVSLRSGALVAPSLYLERTPPAAPAARTPGGVADDSGWFIASAGGLMGTELQRVPVWLLRLKRPDLIPLLGLPVGTLVALGSGRVLALLDASDRDLWPTTVDGPSDQPTADDPG